MQAEIAIKSGVDLAAFPGFTAAMKMLLPMILAGGILFSGCAHSRKSGSTQNPPAVATANTASADVAPQPPAVDAPKLIVTPGSAVTGKVAVYNADGRFVVVDFPLGHMPSAEQRMFVYRNGLKVGELKITGPQKENHTVADVAAGEAQRGDEVRDK